MNDVTRRMIDAMPDSEEETPMTETTADVTELVIAEASKPEGTNVFLLDKTHVGIGKAVFKRTLLSLKKSGRVRSEGVKRGTRYFTVAQ